MIRRTIDIEKNLERNKVLVIYGPRQIGKATSVEEFLSGTRLKYAAYSGDSLEFAHSLARCDLENIKRICSRSLSSFSGSTGFPAIFARKSAR